jgi:DNA polymerase III subunit epsilon
VHAPPCIVNLNDVDVDDAHGLFGPFATRARAKAALTALATPHRLCWKLIGAQSTEGACFAHQLKRCEGFCVGQEPMQSHNLRLLAALAPLAFPVWPYPGPIGVFETHPEAGWQRGHVFDQWRYLGAGADEAELFGIAESHAEVEFDADIFKVLKKCLDTNSHRVLALRTRAR